MKGLLVFEWDLDDVLYALLDVCDHLRDVGILH